MLPGLSAHANRSFSYPSESSRPNHLQRPGRESSRGKPAGAGRRPRRQARDRDRTSAAAARTVSPRPTDGSPQPGDWLWTCRPGAEDDVRDELSARSASAAGCCGGPGAIEPRARTGPGPEPRPTAFSTLTFARQACRSGCCRSISDCELGEAAALIVDGLYRGFKGRPIAVQVLPRIAKRAKPLSSRCTALQKPSRRIWRRAAIQWRRAVRRRMPRRADPHGLPAVGRYRRRRRSALKRSAQPASRRRAARAAAGRGSVALGAQAERGAGLAGTRTTVRRRLRRSGRGARWLESGPGRARLPGHRRRHRRSGPGLSRRIKHVRQNAFEFVPDVPVDWLCCDLAYRPLEVAALLARWAGDAGRALSSPTSSCR